MSRLMRTAAGAAASTALVATGLVLTTSAPAQAEARCTADGKPKSTSGRFTNNTSETIMVKGDKLVNGQFKTVEYAIGRNGGTAWGAGICDADYIKTYYDWYYINHVVDGDTYQKIALRWSCWNAPGSGYRIACGAG
ncbi:hypothetical protein [Actinoplanes sp. NPDC049599]|uniref:hypothetical protein n=1 Tax=Actinoplanes sp. NPDC049599 TaxID=3363903 RepID=UPI00378F66E0